MEDSTPTLCRILRITMTWVLSDKLPTDYSTPWTIQDELLSRAKLVEEACDEMAKYALSDGAMVSQSVGRSIAIEHAKGKGFVIRRHHKWGEVPWHWKYSQIDPFEYAYPWDTKLQFQKKKK